MRWMKGTYPVMTGFLSFFDQACFCSGRLAVRLFVKQAVSGWQLTCVHFFRMHCGLHLAAVFRQQLRKTIAIEI